MHNAQQLLRNLGIKPIASADHLRHCLHLSRGSDIAFLWFLRQLSYQSAPKCTNGFKQPQYTVNERLLLSAIAHLDLITTLRELELVCWCQGDKPPPKDCPPQPLPKRCQQPPEQQRCIRMYESPYLEPLPRPSKRILHQKLAMPTLPGPNFTPYASYSDASHIVANESTRWFAERCTSRFDRKKILGDMFPLDLQRPPDMIAELMDAFEKATQCRCKPNVHITAGDRRPVFPCQLDGAATKADFIRLLEQYVTQILVGTLLKCMLLDRLPVMNYIHVCCTCKLCTEDRERLLRLTRQNGQLKLNVSEYECHIRQYLFGKRKPVDVLGDFNKLLCQQEKCLHVCVNDHWQYEMRMWSEIDYGAGATGAAAAELTEVNRKLAEPLHEMSSRNARFVLAGLPDACRLPVLCEWLKVRCGHVYTRRQRAIAMMKTKMQWQKLERDTKHVAVRPPEEMEVCGHVKGLHFGHRGKIMKCVSIGEIRVDYVRGFCSGID